MAPPHHNRLSSFASAATKKELRVVQILLQLEHAIDMNASAPGPKWGRKRKRSCLCKIPPSPPAPPPAPNNVEPVPPQLESEEKKVDSAPAVDTKDTVSPVSPFAFPHGESVENPRRRSKKRSKTRLEEEYMEAAKEGDRLRKDLEKRSNELNQLKARNSQLNAIKQQVLNSSPNQHKETIANHHHHHHHLQPLVVAHPTAENWLLGPKGIPDLNVAIAEEYQPLDLMRLDRRAICAQARFRRKGLMKLKAMTSRRRL